MEIARTAPGALKILWKEKFFLKSKSVAEVRDTLEKKGYNFTDPNLMMALINVKFLTRKGTRGSFKYVQKHPYIEEKKNESKKRIK